MTKVFVQYGCGLAAPAGWRNFDSSPRLRLEKLPVAGQAARALGKTLFPTNIQYGDIVRGLPVENDSVDGVYASHVLEHLSRDDVKIALANTYRMLKSGGIFRLIVPDLGWRAERYVRERQNGNADAADAFIQSCHFRDSKRATGAVGALRGMFGNSGHLWMYDRALMGKLLTEAGFVDVRPSKFQDSGEPMFDLVENQGRFMDSGNEEASLQARK